MNINIILNNNFNMNKSYSSTNIRKTSTYSNCTSAKYINASNIKAKTKLVSLNSI